MKLYQQISIQECGESLVAIPLELFAVESPHPYLKLGADYDGKSPYYLREGVLDALLKAQNYLQQIYPDWRIKIFDAYRPIQVQQFMVDYSFKSLLETRCLDISKLSPSALDNIWQEVYKFWAVPSLDISLPPPHSTGAALDVTLVNARRETIDMGGEIDEISERSHPNYYQNKYQDQEQQYHQNRQALKQVMNFANFQQHPHEWWHFSLGDQMWAWLYNQEHPHHQVIAKYGRII